MPYGRGRRRTHVAAGTYSSKLLRSCLLGPGLLPQPGRRMTAAPDKPEDAFQNDGGDGLRDLWRDFHHHRHGHHPHRLTVPGHSPVVRGRRNPRVVLEARTIRGGAMPSLGAIRATEPAARLGCCTRSTSLAHPAIPIPAQPADPALVGRGACAAARAGAEGGFRSTRHRRSECIMAPRPRSLRADNSTCSTGSHPTPFGCTRTLLPPNSEPP